MEGHSASFAWPEEFADMVLLTVNALPHLTEREAKANPFWEHRVLATNAATPFPPARRCAGSPVMQ
jgi:hypothetical protein